ncbi:hypothetical protein [Propionibacterium sp.]|uniref:hypothetical protein n=1 Tax=Propionibacterium sp. TaxID=1977903 RepID=UPI0039E7ECEA
MKHATLLLAAALAAGLVLAGCTQQHPAATSTPTPSPSTQQASPAPSSTAPIPATTSHAAPDGTAIPGGKATWLPSLPDPRTVDRTEAGQVLRASVITTLTWDTTVDKTSAYADQRAAIYATQAQRSAQDRYDPDTAKGQGTFIEAAGHRAYTTVTVTGITTEGEDPDQGGNIRRIVAYQVTTQPRDGTRASTTSGHAWVTLTHESGRLAVDTALYRSDQ